MEYLWRRRSTGLTLIRYGVALFVGVCGVAGWGVDTVIPTPYGEFEIAFSVNEGTPTFLVILATALAAALILLGLVLLILETRRSGKKKILAIELRGLRDTEGTPLKDGIPFRFQGHRLQVLVSIRRVDGQIVAPEEALRRITQLPDLIANSQAGTDRSDIAYFAGGLAPVPFSFLMGILLDDESVITLMDWDRVRSSWRLLDGKDDQDRFGLKGFDTVGDAEEIVLSVSVSYPTDMAGIEQAFEGLPIVSMRLNNLTVDGHWSKDKQAALADQFFGVLRELCGSSVKRVNLILAAPNSLVINLGRIYDKRNLPAITVWQYERGKTPSYPWGVQMPVAGERVEIISANTGVLVT
ncbi:hypothetical protein TH19_22925 [Thalassospira profundimaris]|uniref:2-methylthioadenine synthetase n=1 Tax=Thalassospira profundimaris TaxID=502049 RepID=A0A367VVJ3_9PROT|nr:hypothetical protein TH19_22925 [Thalassospira profundimaris]